MNAFGLVHNNNDRKFMRPLSLNCDYKQVQGSIIPKSKVLSFLCMFCNDKIII